MPNLRRGEVALNLGGEPYRLCLTLGALAELEAAFGVSDLSALGERFASGRLGGADLVRLLGVALRGGGHALSEREVAALPLGAGDLEGVAGALGDLFAAAFGAAPANPPRPQAP